MVAPQPPAADDLVEWLNAIDEESMYERPATTKATIDQAAARIQSDAARIAALEARVKVLEGTLGTINSMARLQLDRTLGQYAEDLVVIADMARAALGER